MRIAELGLDRNRACAEAYIPEATTALKLDADLGSPDAPASS